MHGALTTVTFFRYAGWSKVWGMSQMALAKGRIGKVDGLRFWKLLGSGRGFSLKPDFSAYAFLAVWDGEAQAKAFFEGPAFAPFVGQTEERWTVWLDPYRAHGKWSDVSPFDCPPPGEVRDPEGPIAVLTRASIRRSKVARFWGEAPVVGKAIFEDMPGMLFAAGVGELPAVEQGTFSIWESANAMRQVYRDAQHRRAIELTQEVDWYTEELFARFAPLRSEGTWKGSDPLESSPTSLQN